MTRALFDYLLQPRHIAVVGVSQDPKKVGHQIFSNIIESGYAGMLYGVNPKRRQILKHDVFPTLHALPVVPDLVVIVTPGSLVPQIIRECNTLNVPVAIIISAGFAEVGRGAAGLSQQLEDAVQQGPTRVLGPNCLGVFSAIHPLNATFGPALPKKGSIYLISQSGAMVTGVLDWATKKDIGLSHAVTLGNKIDVSEVEALAFAAEDKHTQLVMCYLESFADAPSFFDQASKICRDTPILLLKGGMSPSGIAASQSHTAALATDGVLVEHIARQAGVMVVEDIHEWFSMAELYMSVPETTDNDVAIITNAGGPGVVSTDIASRETLDIEPLTGKTVKRLKLAMDIEHPGNPLDLLGDAVPEAFQKAYRIVSRDTRADLTLIIVTPQTTTHPTRVAELLVAETRRLHKPVAVILIGGSQMDGAFDLLTAHKVPVYRYPHEALSLLGAKIAYDQRRSSTRRFHASYASPLAKKTREMHTQLLRADPLALRDIFQMLKAYDLCIPSFAVAQSLQEVHEVYGQLTRPLAVKTANLDVAHKAKLGGVLLNIHTLATARAAYAEVSKLGTDVLYQEMKPGKVELILGAKRDPVLGTFVTIGLGGSFTNALADRTYVFAPARDKDIHRAFSQTKASAVLEEASIDTSPVLGAIRAVQALMLDQPDIDEMEINPLILDGSTAWVVDFKVTVDQNI